MYRIIETTDYYSLSELFNHSGLEVEIEEKTPPETLKMWRCEDEETGALLGGAVLQFKSGCYVLEDLAVAEDLRRTGIGLKLMNTALEEAKARGAKEIWGCAKVPEYYLTKGWVEMDRQTSPEVSHCQSCEQFNVSCFPCIIKKVFE